MVTLQRILSARAGLVMVVLLTAAGLPAFLRADDEAGPGPDGQFLSLSSPIDGDDYAFVTSWALKLQGRAVRENRKNYLVLEIPDGPSPFHQVYALAEFLASGRLPDVVVVAWIPKTVTGHNGILALAANEIVINPDAEFGDFGRGKALDADKQQQLLKLTARGRNPLLNEYIVKALMDPSVDLQRAKLVRNVDGQRQESVQMLSTRRLTELQNQGALTPEVKEIKTAGSPGVFSGRKLKQLGALVTQTASSRMEIVKLYGLPESALDEPGQDERAVTARLIRLDGPIEWDTEFIIGRQIDRAVAAGANTIVIEIDSPGGLLGPSVNLAERLAGLSEKNIRTVAYVPREAISGGAIIAFGCDEIYLHPDARIGDAGPIEMKQGGQFEHADQKVVSYLREVIQGLAEKKGRPPALLMSMVDRNLPVFRVTDSKTGRVWYKSVPELEKEPGRWTQGPIVDGTQEGRFLAVTGKEAEELLIAEAPVSGVEDLKQRLGVPAEANFAPMQPHWIDGAIFFLTTRPAMFLLFLGGIFFLYLELHLPSGMFGILAALCFVLFFWARFLNGTAGWLEVLLFLTGLVCIGLEIFVIPGFGVVGISGGVLVIASLVMASQTFGEMSPTDSTQEVLKSLGTLFGAGVTVVIFAVAMSHFLPSIPLFNRLILSPPGAEEYHDPDEPRLRTSDAPTGPYAELMGSRGEAITLLKPFGKARLDGQMLDVVSVGPLIDSGAKVEVIRVEGRKIFVREVT